MPTTVAPNTMSKPPPRQVAEVVSLCSRSPGVPNPPSLASRALDHSMDPERFDVFTAYVDRAFHAAIAHMSGGLSPAALAGAYADWFVHLALSPGKQMHLLDRAGNNWARLLHYGLESAVRFSHGDHCIEPLPQDRRFAHEGWQRWPYDLMHQAHLLQQQWWHDATTGVGGVTKQHEKVVEFVSRQILDMLSPSNLVATNPAAQQRTLDTAGMNFVQGLRNFFEDYERHASGRPPVGTERFRVGRDVATAPGQVIYQNELIELIQYAPTTEQVRTEPVLIVPAWIMKYYILDLSPANSLVRYLTSRGFTVFMISWKNPEIRNLHRGPDADYGMDDYRQLGIMAALDAIDAIVGKPVHGVGYCIGGTLLSIAAAAMARDGDARLKTVTFLAAQQDFTEAGELTLFINESQIHFLEDLMWTQGHLEARQMAGAFQLLRSNDLIWSRIVREYLMGERIQMTDLMAWNADATRMPYRMHSEYLRRLFLNNDLAEGRFKVEGRPIALTDIRVPIFAVGTERDHVAPWRSAFKVHLLTNTAVTFLLTTGGHNAGIVSDLGRAGRSFRVLTKVARDRYLDPDIWEKTAVRKEGSWWPEWVSWLEDHSGTLAPPPSLGAAEAGYPPLGRAPGSYVFDR
jgi:poly[(R)-3-hydroxyalkanoate] polymerase subunit PhaC